MEKNAVGRSITMILMQVKSTLPEVSTCSRPSRFVGSYPGVGEIIVSTQPISLPKRTSLARGLSSNRYHRCQLRIASAVYARILFSGFQQIVDAMGGLDYHLEESPGGLEPATII